jgi:polyisoprenoid-binding protein YceI
VKRSTGLKSLHSFRMVAVAALALLGCGVPPAQAQQLVPEKSFVRFVSKQMNVPVEGIFRKFTAQIAWNVAKPEASTARIELEPGSIELGMEDINKEARGKDWFDTAAQPRAQFVSTSVKMIAAGRFESAGKLTIKGRTRDVVASFSARPEAGGMLFEGAFPIKRLEFGIGEGSWGDPNVVANEVEIRFRLQLAAQPAKK